jgi:hypothetical protein
MERSDLLRVGIDLPTGEPVVLAVFVVTVDGGRAGSGAQKRVRRT